MIDKGIDCCKCKNCPTDPSTITLPACDLCIHKDVCKYRKLVDAKANFASQVYILDPKFAEYVPNVFTVAIDCNFFDDPDAEESVKL